MKGTRLTLAALLSAFFMFGTAQTVFAADDMNCGDFATQSEAQAHFDGQDGDPDDLDRDGDDIACESLPEGDGGSSDADASESNVSDSESTSSDDATSSESDTTSEDNTSSENAAPSDDTTSEDEQGGELPDTATALPLGILGGLGAMALGALGMRKRQ